MWAEALEQKGHAEQTKVAENVAIEAFEEPALCIALAHGLTLRVPWLWYNRVCDRGEKF